MGMDQDIEIVDSCGTWQGKKYWRKRYDIHYLMCSLLDMPTNYMDVVDSEFSLDQLNHMVVLLRELTRDLEDVSAQCRNERSNLIRYKAF